jgi:hypothetical protein
LAQHGDPSPGPQVADRDRELRAQERIPERFRLALQGMPHRNFRWAEFSRPDD